MKELIISIRAALVTIFICCILYTAAVYAVGRLSSDKAEGSLITDHSGRVIGSRLIAQKFSKPEYFHSRPSEGGFNASSSGGSNFSPYNMKIRKRAEGIIKAEKSGTGDIPADMVTESGSGLDPDITVANAVYQAKRVAMARKIPIESVNRMISGITVSAGNDKNVNVLELNMFLDRARYEQ